MGAGGRGFFYWFTPISGKRGQGYRPGGFGLFSPFPTVLLGASELARQSELTCMISHSVSYTIVLS